MAFLIQDIFSLPIREQISPVFSIRTMEQLDLLVVDHPKIQASFAFQGAHLLSWKPEGEDEVFWLSSETLWKKGVAIRGGVPICWPWFGASPQEGLPSHGFARNLPWTLKSHLEDVDSVSITFELLSSDNTKQFWPHDFILLAHFRLSTSCEISLEAHGSFEVTSALHSYFSIGDIHEVSVHGLGDQFIDKVEGGQGKLADGIQTFPDRIDRVYLNPQPLNVISDNTLDRDLEVHHHQHMNVVCWNPGPALSSSMKDLSDDGFKTFVCVETACITKSRKITKENPFQLAQTIRIIKKYVPNV